MAPFAGADGDGDGTIDQDDLGVWRANFGRTFAAVGHAAQLELETRRGTGAASSVEGDHLGEVERGEHVAVADDEALVDAGDLGGVADAAGGPQRLVLHRVPELEIAEAAVREARRERVGEVPERQHDLVDAVPVEPAELALEERLVRDG